MFSAHISALTEYGRNEERFWTASPAASEIFEHVETHPGLKGRRWCFNEKSGFVTFGRTGATFSCASASEKGTETEFVVAETES